MALDKPTPTQSVDENVIQMSPIVPPVSDLLFGL